MWSSKGLKKRGRRVPRAATFRSRDLVRELRPHFAPFLKEGGFRRLTEQSWITDYDGQYLIIAVQASQIGWEDRAGGKFIVEFELTSRPTRGYGPRTARLWSLLDEEQRKSARSINDHVALTLPMPNPALLAQLPSSVAAHYLVKFQPMKLHPRQVDVWFQYYDEADAATWGVFLAGAIDLAMVRFLEG